MPPAGPRDGSRHSRDLRVCGQAVNPDASHVGTCMRGSRPGTDCMSSQLHGYCGIGCDVFVVNPAFLHMARLQSACCACCLAF